MNGDPAKPMLVVNDTLRIPLREFTFTFARSAGPGGQNVNKVNSKALLRWSVVKSRHLPEDVRQRLLKKYRRRITKEGDLLVVSQRFRDQGRNVADCTERLREMLGSVATAPKPRKKSRPTAASSARRLRDKQAQARKKEARKMPRKDD